MGEMSEMSEKSQICVKSAEFGETSSGEKDVAIEAGWKV